MSDSGSAAQDLAREREQRDEFFAQSTPPLPQRMRDAAETIEQLNAMAGMGLNCSVSPVWLRREADVLEQEDIG